MQGGDSRVCAAAPPPAAAACRRPLASRGAHAAAAAGWCRQLPLWPSPPPRRRWYAAAERQAAAPAWRGRLLRVGGREAAGRPQGGENRDRTECGLGPRWRLGCRRCGAAQRGSMGAVAAASAAAENRSYSYAVTNVGYTAPPVGQSRGCSGQSCQQREQQDAGSLTGGAESAAVDWACGPGARRAGGRRRPARSLMISLISRPRRRSLPPSRCRSRCPSGRTARCRPPHKSARC